MVRIASSSVAAASVGLRIDTTAFAALAAVVEDVDPKPSPEPEEPEANALTPEDSEVSLTAALSGFQLGSTGLLTGYGTATGMTPALGPIFAPPFSLNLLRTP